LVVGFLLAGTTCAFGTAATGVDPAAPATPLAAAGASTCALLGLGAAVAAEYVLLREFHVTGDTFPIPTHPTAIHAFFVAVHLAVVTGGFDHAGLARTAAVDARLIAVLCAIVAGGVDHAGLARTTAIRTRLIAVLLAVDAGGWRHAFLFIITDFGGAAASTTDATTTIVAALRTLGANRGTANAIQARGLYAAAGLTTTAATVVAAVLASANGDARTRITRPAAIYALFVAVHFKVVTGGRHQNL
jgi:hypothetical protein